ncbi:guanylate-binding protein 1-like isoform X1 [Mya arenaria]|uniref:guanylate-binding protein 1-like isoform X1 n=2 Tax=Mya arenaria TaxID=6604 RepID=UPI0022E5F0CA|nr:guanylate-binding protein 1-like isoform X1 [Mya arenaria]
MASNGNPTDSSGVDLKMTLKSFEHTSKVEPTQTRRTNNPTQSSPMKRPDSAPPAVVTDKELPSRETPVMASNENHTDLSASMDLKMTEIRRKNNPNKPPPMKRPDSAPPAVITEKEMPSRETYLSTTDSSVFKVPQCLVRARGENLLEVCEDVLDEISRIDTPCVIVAIAGPYRTGKSYLMNRLADAQTGFAIGDTIQSTTKGIWVWCRDHPEQKDTVLILLDTEGIGDVEKGDSNHDNRIFTLATLLSSVLVYNMKGAFDQEAVNKLSFVSEMSKNIKFGGRCDEENLLLQSVLPGFVLALRDFSLKLMKDGRKITPDEYFEESLESKTDKSVSFNKPRECIRKFFQQDKRRCFAFPPPGDIDILENLECLTFEDLSKRFQTVAAMIVSYIYSQKPKQLQVSKPVNGPMFATLTRKYVDALARGAVPDVDDAFASAAKIENERVKDECMDMFRLRIEDVDLPLPSSSLDKHFTEARCSALEYMSTNVVQDVASLIEKHALMEMDLFRQQFQRQNEEEIEKHCTNVLLGLASFSNLQAGLQNKGYEVIGGHRKFKQDVDMVRQEYEQALRNYEQREIGLVWKSFAKQLGPKETKILDKDDELSKEEKKREKEENEISMKRMKIELDKANQNALHKQMKELDEQQKKLNTELRRRDKEHEDKVTALQDKIASLESNKEVQKKMLDQITSLLEEDKREKKKANKKLEEKHRREREKREELEQKERERKGGFVINRVLNALWNN